MSGLSYDQARIFYGLKIVLDMLSVVRDNVVKILKGMTDIAKATNLSRQHLYRALSENGSPQFDTIVKVLQALDCQLSIKTAYKDLVNESK